MSRFDALPDRKTASKMPADNMKCFIADDLVFLCKLFKFMLQGWGEFMSISNNFRMFRL